MDIVFLPCLFFGMMLLTLKIDALYPLYGIFRSLSLNMLPVLLRMCYASYIIAAVLVILYVWCLVSCKRDGITVEKSVKIREAIYWSIFIIEMLFHETHFQNIISF